ncbi:MAG: gliding motility-associated C-terminal domain-containing protein [Bacteroidales bacterium]|nr:gliding motility-associated C-terminal domain-containing protein [Bacteroidales bacterium]
MDNLIIPTDTLRICRGYTLHIQPADTSLLAQADTALVFQWTSSYEWHDTTTNPFFVFPTGDVDLAGTIWVKITDTVNMYTRHDTIVVDIFPIPQITRFQIDTILCFGDELVLKICQEASNVYGLRWQIFSGAILLETIYDSTSLHIFFDSSKLNTRNLSYVLTYTGFCALNENRFDITDLERYTVRDTAFVSFVRPPTIDLGTDTIICYDYEGKELELIALDTRYFDISQYEFLWNNNNQNDDNTFWVTYEAQGKQVVRVWNEACWTNRGIESYLVVDTVSIDFWNRRWTEPYRLRSIIDSDTLVCERIHVTLDATAETPNLTTYLWLNENRADTLGRNPAITLPSGTYILILRDSVGCEREFSITVNDENCDPSLEMPDVFTPNNDGINDFFRPTTLERVYNFHLRIYNRAGRMVYEFGPIHEFPSEQQWPGWNGRIGGTGSEAPEGVYFWAVRYDDSWGRVQRMQGTVTLLR